MRADAGTRWERDGSQFADVTDIHEREVFHDGIGGCGRRQGRSGGGGGQSADALIFHHKAASMMASWYR